MGGKKGRTGGASPVKAAMAINSPHGAPPYAHMTPPRRRTSSLGEHAGSPALVPRSGGGGEGVLDTHPGNQFRSNVEFYERPRQLLVLGCMMGVMMYVAYAHEASTPVSGRSAAWQPIRVCAACVCVLCLRRVRLHAHVCVLCVCACDPSAGLPSLCVGWEECIICMWVGQEIQTRAT